MNSNEIRRIIRIHRKLALNLEKVLLNELSTLCSADASIDTSAKQVNNIRAASPERIILSELLFERRQLYREIKLFEKDLEELDNVPIPENDFGEEF